MEQLSVTDLLLDHIKEERRWQTRIEERLDVIDRKVSFWRGGLAVFAFAIPIIVALVTAQFAK